MGFRPQIYLCSWLGITYNGRPLEWFSQRWVLHWPNLLLDCFGLGPAEEIPRLPSYSFEIWAKPLNPKLCSCFLSCISPLIFVPTPNFCPSPPIYTPFSMGQSWWRNLWFVSGSLHSQCLGGFLSLDHCSPIAYHVLERGPTFCYWDDPLVTSAQWWILCSAGGFSQGTTLSSWLIHVLVGKLVEMRFLTQDASLHSRLVWACFGPGPPRKGPKLFGGWAYPFRPTHKNKIKIIFIPHTYGLLYSLHWQNSLSLFPSYFSIELLRKRLILASCLSICFVILTSFGQLLIWSYNLFFHFCHVSLHLLSPLILLPLC